MKIFRDTEFCITEPTALTLGKFDGVHLGHQKLIQRLMEKKKQGRKTAVFTFSKPPSAVARGQAQKVLMTMEERELILEAMGVDYLIEYPCDETLIRTSAEDFIENIIVEKCHAAVVVVGTDFHFGYQRKGDWRLLNSFSSYYGYELLVQEKMLDEESGKEISSTYIKEEIRNGYMEHAARMLGRPYFFAGSVMHGMQLARNLDIPTMNLHPQEEKIVPPLGVYCIKAFVEGQWYDGIANLGYKPTVTNERVLKLEVHLFKFHKFVYGKTIRVMLYSFVRAEMKFLSIQQLKEQMEQDVQYGKRYSIYEMENSRTDPCYFKLF